eukprot:TRINITY_DN12828_c0_g1_i1.p1 TRINITY_DN12828_c0_g1~~TRINITY_DN12828_c0_g1_i1.p1  ORF type:complete len:102 (-),score=24.17 TRINITY_DN12828_c0_g1_i1:18-323(-)
MKSKRESVLDLEKYINKPITVKFTGGREVQGILKGYDTLVNLVLDDTIEFLRVPNPSPDMPSALQTKTRKLRVTVCRGTSVLLICPVDGTEEIANPFQQDG